MSNKIVAEGTALPLSVPDEAGQSVLIINSM
jgi:hypothetical protein